MHQQKFLKGALTAVSLVILFGGRIPSAAAAGTILYVANYLESITTLKLVTPNTATGASSSSSSAELRIVAKTPGCGQVSLWLTHDPATNRLFCMDENLPNGTVSSFETHPDGSLSQLAIVDTIGGTVASTLFGQGNGLAVAY